MTLCDFTRIEPDFSPLEKTPPAAQFWLNRTGSSSFGWRFERVVRFELTTSYLAEKRSTPELHPHKAVFPQTAKLSRFTVASHHPNNHLLGYRAHDVVEAAAFVTARSEFPLTFSYRSHTQKNRPALDYHRKYSELGCAAEGGCFCIDKIEQMAHLVNR